MSEPRRRTKEQNLHREGQKDAKEEQSLDTKDAKEGQSFGAKDTKEDTKNEKEIKETAS